MFKYKIENINKNSNVMVIALLWLGLICCGVATGLIYDHVQAPQSYYYMVAIGTVDVILLIYHRIYTRDWCKPKKKLKKNERRQQHFQVFGISAIFSIAAFLSSVPFLQTGECSWGFFIGSAMLMVSIFIATARESDYVWNF